MSIALHKASRINKASIITFIIWEKDEWEILNNQYGVKFWRNKLHISNYQILKHLNTLNCEPLQELNTPESLTVF